MVSNSRHTSNISRVNFCESLLIRKPNQQNHSPNYSLTYQPTYRDWATSEDITLPEVYSPYDPAKKGDD